MPQSITQLLKILSRLRRKYCEHPFVTVDRFLLQAEIFSKTAIAFYQRRGDEKNLHTETARMIVETLNLFLATGAKDTTSTALEKATSSAMKELKASLECGIEPVHAITPLGKEAQYDSKEQ